MHLKSTQEPGPTSTAWAWCGGSAVLTDAVPPRPSPISAPHPLQHGFCPPFLSRLNSKSPTQRQPTGMRPVAHLPIEGRRSAVAFESRNDRLKPPSDIRLSGNRGDEIYSTQMSNDSRRMRTRTSPASDGNDGRARAGGLDWQGRTGLDPASLHVIWRRRPAPAPQGGSPLHGEGPASDRQPDRDYRPVLSQSIDDMTGIASSQGPLDRAPLTGPLDAAPPLGVPWGRGERGERTRPA
jgi:hypothetical protein